MQLGRIGTLVGFAISVLGAGLVVVLPDQRLIGWALVAVGLVTLVVTIYSWLFSFFRARARKRERPVTMDYWPLIIIGLVGGGIFFTVGIVASILEMDRLSANINRFVIPRELSSDQERIIEQYLLPRPPQKLMVVSTHPDNEASKYASQLYTVLRRAGWDVSITNSASNTPQLPRVINDGLATSSFYPNGQPQPKTTEILTQALQQANVPYEGSASGTSREVSEPITFLLVGHRPRR